MLVAQGPFLRHSASASHQPPWQVLTHPPPLAARRQLGYPAGGRWLYGPLSGSPLSFPAGSEAQTIWLDGITCKGNEARLGDCPARPWGLSNCLHRWV